MAESVFLAPVAMWVEEEGSGLIALWFGLLRTASLYPDSVVLLLSASQPDSRIFLKSKRETCHKSQCDILRHSENVGYPESATWKKIADDPGPSQSRSSWI